MIGRRQPTGAGDHLSFDDLDGWRFHAIVTNVAPAAGTAAEVEHHHRPRGGPPEEAIRQLKDNFGLGHAPVENFFGNWLWWHAAALAYNVGRWARALALPPPNVPQLIWRERHKGSSLKVDSYRLKDRDLGRVPTDDGT